jgi:hypothetical protein
MLRMPGAVRSGGYLDTMEDWHEAHGGGRCGKSRLVLAVDTLLLCGPDQRCFCSKMVPHQHTPGSMSAPPHYTLVNGARLALLHLPAL